VFRVSERFELFSELFNHLECASCSPNELEQLKPILADLKARIAKLERAL
jgi:hypothetical protein